MGGCVFAWTSTENYVYYPPYLNVSVVDGEIVFTVRSPECVDGPGETARLSLPREQVVELRSKLFDALKLTQ